MHLGCYCDGWALKIIIRNSDFIIQAVCVRGGGVEVQRLPGSASLQG